MRFGAQQPGRDLDVLVLGDVNPDLVLADADIDVAFGQAERIVGDAGLTIGGSGAIMACAAARLGLRTAIAGVVGDDLFGEFMVGELQKRGVDTSGVVVDGALRTGVTVVLARGEDRAILTYPGAIGAMSADRVDAGLLGRARHVHVAAFFLQSGLAAGLSGLLAAARGAGASTSVDPNWDPSGCWDGGLRELLPYVDVLLPNAVEVCRIAGLEDPAEAAQALAALGPLVAVKLGAKGAIAAQEGQEPIAAAAPGGITPVDTVGAGDTFDAGLLAGLAAGESVEHALALACACGTLSTRGAGGTDAQPTLGEAQTLRGGR
ncbi:MAG TPA: carbohydrate kinase family protein [Solirubrobacteraceae bacterium]|nr:carbohydrate kinase family protein [Solirubrobacteraceae bacterium]